MSQIGRSKYESARLLAIASAEGAAATALLSELADECRATLAAREAFVSNNGPAALVAYVWVLLRVRVCAVV